MMSRRARRTRTEISTVIFIVVPEMPRANTQAFSHVEVQLDEILLSCCNLDLGVGCIFGIFHT